MQLSFLTKTAASNTAFVSKKTTALDAAFVFERDGGIRCRFPL